jgi:hypothetical protein
MPNIILVVIYLKNGKKFEIRKGEHSISKIKNKLWIPQDFILRREYFNTHMEFDDDGSYYIQGGEIFSGMARQGGVGADN